MKLGISSKLKKHRKLAITLAILVVVGVVYINFLRPDPSKLKSLSKTSVSTLKKTSLQDSVSVSGTVKSKNSKNVYTTLNYPVKEIKVEVGDTVKAGDVLAVLDTSTVSKDVEQAQYTAKSTEESNRLILEKAKSDYDNQLYQYNNNLNSELLNAKAAVTSSEQDLKTEKSTYEYDKYLNSIGELSKMALDQEAAKLQTLQNTYDKAVSTLSTTQNKVQQDLKNAKNSYQSAQAKYNDKSQQVSLEKQQQNLKDATIVAPIDGTVTVSNAVVGSTANGTLFTIEDLSVLVVDAEVKEYDVADITEGKKVEVKTDATGDTTIAGVVSKVAPAATASTQGTSNVTFATEVKITENNPKVKVGMKARLNIILNEKSDIYAVPYDAVLHKPDGSAYVLAAEKSKNGKLFQAKEVPVKTGLENDISIEISGDGLSDGMQVVSSPDNMTSGSILNL